MLIAIVLFTVSISARLVTVPTFPFEHEGSGAYSMQRLHGIIVHAPYADSVNENGQTLIPPTLEEFAQTFREDLLSVTGIDLPVTASNFSVADTIFITVDPNRSYLDAAGRNTSEGYSLVSSEAGIVISGASALGAWWGTRTLLQVVVLNDGNIPHGRGNDAPGWATRGAMLDCGRHYYPPEFLIEMCAYLSFFKQNEFHLHLSDNLFVNDELYTPQQVWALYSSFRLWSDDEDLRGLAQLRNESYDQTQFRQIQQQCAARGVTIIPEIEAPAHALAISKWKPHLALDEDPTLLNISHSETMPTLESIWRTFLPWFSSKTVHIGADEYKKDLIQEYTHLVNELSMFVWNEAGRKTRIWGTFTPDAGANVSKEVVIQHWAPYEDNAYFDFIQNGYDVLNSDMKFYTNVKWNGYFPPTLNTTTIFNGNPLGGGFAPHIFDVKNATNNPSRDDPRVVGHIAAQWNDYGPATSTYLEAYRGWRSGLPALADKQWGGSLQEDDYSAVLESLVAAAPGQNLDRRIKSISEVILDYQFSPLKNSSDMIEDLSGNGYDGASRGCIMPNSTLVLDGNCFVETSLESKGRDYALSFSVYPTSNAPGVLFYSEDSALVSGNGSHTNITFIAAGTAFPLNYSLPLHTWTHVTVSGVGESTFLSVLEDDGSRTRTMEFLSKIEANGVASAAGVMVIWKPIAFEAPLKEIGRGFHGMIRNLTLKALA
ncbi:hypothetical protein CkaCkLH20_02351 [Colletotrichum karsti]|uniref:beta-N-acetylhexosaminidase n=1 Tax=Colletotrichum karsti TaxID=1095194 RepID=A0A9P6LQ69_9PEZI|nr:uncharacterized protein CkaCkLH20_02351 [Colletotrichum karsti]KAF9880397.1 hypothetical protein CkaCkLH20_02351 [Colletotrichum karsti]